MCGSYYLEQQAQLRADLADALVAAGHGETTAPSLSAASSKAATAYVDLLRAELAELHTDAGREELRTQLEEFGIQKDVQDFIIYTLYITNPVRAAQLGGGKTQDTLVDQRFPRQKRSW